MPTMSTKDFPTSPKGKSSKNLFSSLPAELRQHILHYTFDESYEKDLRENICWVSHERAAWGPKPYEDWKVFTFAVDDWDRQLRKQKAGWGEHIKQDLDYVLKKRKGEMQEDFKNWRVGGDWGCKYPYCGMGTSRCWYYDCVDRYYRTRVLGEQFSKIEWG